MATYLFVNLFNKSLDLRPWSGADSFFMHATEYSGYILYVTGSVEEGGEWHFAVHFVVSKWNCVSHSTWLKYHDVIGLSVKYFAVFCSITTNDPL